MTVFFDRGAGTFDSDTLQDGLYISLIGVGVVLVVLALVAVAIMLLDRLDSMFPAEAAPANAVMPARRPASPAPAAPRPADPGAQTAAAIAVALALAEQEATPRRAASRPEKINGNNDSSWVYAGRTRQMRGWPPNTARGRQK